MNLFVDANVSAEIGQWRMKTDDFKLIKVIGRGAFGEVTADDRLPITADESLPMAHDSWLTEDS